jgi:hypothetical protein
MNRTTNWGLMADAGRRVLQGLYLASETTRGARFIRSAECIAFFCRSDTKSYKLNFHHPLNRKTPTLISVFARLGSAARWHLACRSRAAGSPYW